MRIGLQTTFSVNKKEPLAALLERIHASFLASGQGEPVTQFSFSDAPVPGFVSSVDRVLKRYPEFERFAATFSAGLGVPPVRRIANGPGSPAPDELVEFSKLHAIAVGVPRSFPFHSLSIRLCGPAFGEPCGPSAGVFVGDSWWVNGRQRSVRSIVVVEVDPANQKLPPLPDPVAVVMSACGKAKSTMQAPLLEAPPASSDSVRAVIADYRKRFPEIVDQLAFPHDLPPRLDALKNRELGQTAGPRKPALIRAFKPLGYDCRGGSGTFTLRRRTAGNLTVEIHLDVGTWSHSVTASFLVQGLGFHGSLFLPVSKRAGGGGQYPIGSAEQWERIVENLAALAVELDRSFVPAIEAAAGPTPEWYKPPS